MPSIPRLDYSSQGGRQFEGVQNAVNAVGDVSITNGRAITVSLTVTAQQVAHGLGRAYKGYFPVSLSAASTVFNSASSDPAKFVALTASVPCSAVIWVF